MSQSATKGPRTKTTEIREALETILRCHDEGTGLLDSMDNGGERYTSQALFDAIIKARAALRAGEPPR